MAGLTLKSKFEGLKPIKEKTIPEYLLPRAKFYAEQGRDFWLVDGLTDEKRYFKNFDDETRKIASAFHKLGLRKGDVVIFMIRDLAKVYILHMGVWRANGVVRASYPEDDADTILSRVRENNVKHIVCEEDAVPMIATISEKVDWKINIIRVNRPVSDDGSALSLQKFLDEDNGADCPELQIGEDDPAIILSTSGTTGLPKGAVHTHKSFLTQMRSLEQGPFTLHKPNLIATKATHISGSITGLILMGIGKTGVVVSNLSKENIFTAVEKYKPGYVFAFPTFLIALADAHGNGHDFSSIEVIYTAGVLVTPAIRQSFAKLPNVKDVVVAFGMTETLLCATSAILVDDDKKDALGMRDLPNFSVGKVCPGSELQFRNPESQKILGPNEQGEICVKSPGLFKCYLNNPKATEEAFVDDFFRTGDIGYYDEAGFVYIVDRLKEIFKYYNDHISPTEIENIIMKHPNVSEVCVVGIPDEGGHVPRAFVRLHSGNKEEIAKEIQEFANANLASYKHLRGGVYVVDELPKGKTGKISRQLVQKIQV